MEYIYQIIGCGWMGIDILETDLTEEQSVERMKQIMKNKEYARYDTIMRKRKPKENGKDISNKESSIADIFNSLTDERKKLVYAMIYDKEDLSNEQLLEKYKDYI